VDIIVPVKNFKNSLIPTTVPSICCVNPTRILLVLSEAKYSYSFSRLIWNIVLLKYEPNFAANNSFIQLLKILKDAVINAENERNKTEVYIEKFSIFLELKKIFNNGIFLMRWLLPLFCCRELKKGITEDNEIISAKPLIKSINDANKKNNKYFLGK
tara:strand:+ start:90 stop:560 length:471 start_codon:yes stop_codon:yes gene_type:complete